MGFLTDFGVKPILLIAQIVNFALLLFILQRFLYKPLLKVLADRKQKIADGLKNAEEIEKKLEQITAEREKRLKETAKETEGILKEATQMATKIIADAHTKAGNDVEKIFEKSKQSIEQEREKMRQEMRAELAGLVVAGLQIVTGKVLSEKDQKNILEESLKGLNNG
jgi:F-type H+-transporting ATPase subunit b